MAATALSTATGRGRQRALEYLSLRIGQKEFAVQIARVREIMFLQDLVSVPGMPPYAKGIITVYGAVVPVLDLRSLLGLPERGRTHRTCIVVVRIESTEVGSGRLVGLIVDSVSDVVQNSDSDERVLTRCRRRHRSTTLLDVDTLLPSS